MTPTYFFLGKNPLRGLAGFFSIKGNGFQVLYASDCFHFEGIDTRSQASLVRGFKGRYPSHSGWNTCTESEFLAMCKTLKGFSQEVEDSILSSEERQIEMFPETSAYLAVSGNFTSNIIW